MGLVYDYGVLLKPKVLLAMLALYLSTYFTSTLYSGTVPFNTILFLKGFLAVTFSVAGANAINCYIDRDIDSVMVRTRGRPLVLGTISPLGALSFGGVTIVVAMGLAISLGALPIILLIEGAGSYILLYSILLKRRTVINVLFTAPSVAAPAWFGWHLGGAPLYPVGLMMGLMVAIWGPLHLWSISFAYEKDYARVGVPMFPSIVPRQVAINGVLVALGLLLGSSYLLVPWAGSLLYSVGVTLINILLVYVGFRLHSEKSNKAGWVLFKLTAPYIILVFILFMVSKVV
jgi:protoheme IX farnesyltransferase